MQPRDVSDRIAFRRVRAAADVVGAPEVLVDFHARWDRWRRGRPMPARPDFTPHDLTGHLGFVLLYDVLPGDRFVFRLVGSEVSRRVGRDTTGMDIGQAYHGRSLDKIRHCCRMIRNDGCGLLTSARVQIPGKDALSYVALSLPLSTDGTRVDMFIARMLFIDTPMELGAALD